MSATQQLSWKYTELTASITYFRLSFEFLKSRARAPPPSPAQSMPATSYPCARKHPRRDPCEDPSCQYAYGLSQTPPSLIYRGGGVQGAGGDPANTGKPCLPASSLPPQQQLAYAASRALSWLIDGATASVGWGGGAGGGFDAGGFSLGASGSASLSFDSDRNSTELVLRVSIQAPTVLSSKPNWGGGGAANMHFRSGSCSSERLTNEMYSSRAGHQ